MEKNRDAEKKYLERKLEERKEADGSVRKWCRCELD